jgi:hypothetical protein
MIPYIGVLFSLASLVCWIIYWVKIAGYNRQLLESKQDRYADRDEDRGRARYDDRGRERYGDRDEDRFTEREKHRSAGRDWDDEEGQYERRDR